MRELTQYSGKESGAGWLGISAGKGTNWMVLLLLLVLVMTGSGIGMGAQPKSVADLPEAALAEPGLRSRQVQTTVPSLLGTNALGQFPPKTASEQELEKMLRGKDEDIDLALANWLIAADVRQFGDLTRDAYFKELDAITEQVRQSMETMRTSGWKGADPSDPASRCRLFCNAIIGLRFAYCEEYRQENLTPAQMKALHGNAVTGQLKTSQSGSIQNRPL